jgi:hypothetical protein
MSNIEELIERSEYARLSILLRRLWHEAGAPTDLAEFVRRPDVNEVVVRLDNINNIKRYRDGV